MSFSSLYSRYPALFERLAKECPSLSADIPLGKHTSFRIGGPAAATVTPEDLTEFHMILDAIRDMAPDLPVCVLGKGSNVLVDDEGYEGLVIFTKELQRVNFSLPDEDGWVTVFCECGASLSVLAGQCVNDGRALEGLAFAYKIPGSIGGAVVMNAGAFDGEMSDIVERVEYYDPTDGDTKTATREELDFSYRHSLFSDHPEYVVLSAVLHMKQGDLDTITKDMSRNFAARQLKQPLNTYNAGSIFKRPKGLYAAKLIDECGLKGYRVGGACVSEKHAGFIVNDQNATAKDVKDLVNHIKEVVWEKCGVRLECEIKMISSK